MTGEHLRKMRMREYGLRFALIPKDKKVVAKWECLSYDDSELRARVWFPEQLWVRVGVYPCYQLEDGTHMYPVVEILS